MAATLIIKTGASGDVLRSTVILHALQGEVYWITSEYNLPLFPDDQALIKELVAIEKIPPHFFERLFDQVINLEEDRATALLSMQFKTKKRIGVKLVNDQLVYEQGSAGWLDLSRISVHGKEKANELKYANTFSYQQHLYSMIGKEFKGEEYVLYGHKKKKTRTPLVRIGIETRAGDVWPNKRWGGYDALAIELSKLGYEIIFFRERPHLREYMQDIHACDLVISGDTLAMHLALGYGIPAIALFNCTSPQEIYSYGLLTKLVSPLLHEVYYQQGSRQDVINSIQVKDVLEAVKQLNQ